MTPSDSADDPSASSRPPAEPAVDAPRELLLELARESLVERRRARRWSIFFRTVTLLLLGAVAFALLSRAGPPARGGGGADEGGEEGHTALVSVEGVIAADAVASVEPLVRALDAAYEDEDTRGIVLHVNSPGGSPVQSGLVHDAIRARRERHPDVPVHAVIGDVAASGGYYVAVAAENIYANRASIVGSIGARLDSFGAVEAIEKLGIEQRQLTAGEHKALLDPFSPVDEVARERLQALLDNVHAQFIGVVREGRGARLDDDPALFSGLVWSGEEALGNGLVDALSDTAAVARDIVGAARVVDFTEPDDPLSRLRRELGAALGRGVGEALAASLGDLSGGLFGDLSGGPSGGLSDETSGALSGGTARW